MRFFLISVVLAIVLALCQVNAQGLNSLTEAAAPATGLLGADVDVNLDNLLGGQQPESQQDGGQQPSDKEQPSQPEEP